MKYELIVNGDTGYYHLNVDGVYVMAKRNLGLNFQLYRENEDHTKIAEGILSWEALDECMRWERRRFAA